MDTELRQHLEAMESRLNGHIDARTGPLDARMGQLDSRMEQFDSRMDQMENRLTVKMRDMQTELLRGFASFSEGQNIRLRKLEADQSNLDASLSGRMAVLEGRLLQIEMRLGGAGRN
jgi:hypothetical protein